MTTVAVSPTARKSKSVPGSKVIVLPLSLIDAVLTTGLLAHLAETYPHARITVACGPAAAPLFEAAPNVVRMVLKHFGEDFQ